MFESYSDGWGNYGGDASVDALMGFPTMGAIVYTPDLNPVGSGSAGTYYPRDTREDARALNYLGFYPSPYYESHQGTSGSQKADIAQSRGAWDPEFQYSVELFQKNVGLTPDGWVGPNTRKALAAAVAAKNAAEVTPIVPPVPPPMPVPVPPLPSPDIIPPSPGPTPSPVVDKPSDNTMKYVAIGAGALALLGVGYWALSD